MSKREKFIESYENNIKHIRKKYYKAKVNEGLTNTKSSIVYYLINYIPLFVAILLSLIGNFSLLTLIISIFVLLILTILISIIKKLFGLNEEIYQLEIMKLGYFSIDQYEQDIEKYITGPEGYYKEVLQHLINEYKITKEDTYTIEDTRGNEYILHNNNEKDEIYIINNNLKELPKVNKLKYSNIRYYRMDDLNNRLILKTDLDELYYKKESEIAFDKIIKNKKIKEQAEYKPEDYINDYERFINKIKNKDLRKQQDNEIKKEYCKKRTVLLIILDILLIVLSYFYKDYKTIIALVHICLLFGINYYLIKYYLIKNIYIKTDKEYIVYLNNDKDCLDKFKELKLALRIPKEIEKIYSDEGAEFLCWDNKGYFHLFLNLIYFNAIYIVVKISDVEYYKLEGNTCTVKIKDKSYTFNQDAKKIFDKLLPNKDYNWTHGTLDNSK